jgi:WD40 repeat protein
VTPDGALALTGGQDGASVFWVVASGRQVRDFTQPHAAVVSAALAPDGLRALTGGSDGSVVLWDTRSGQEVCRVTSPAAVTGVAFSPQGTAFAVARRDGSARVFDTCGGRALSPVLTHKGAINGITFHPQGDRVATSSDDGTAMVWDVVTGRPRLPDPLKLRGRVTAIAFSPDGTRFLAGGEEPHCILWDVDRGQEVARVATHAGHVTSVVFTPDRRRVLTAGWDGTVAAWDAKTLRQIRRFTLQPAVPGPVTLSPGGGRALAIECLFVGLGDIESGKMVRQLRGVVPPVNYVQGSHGGAYVSASPRARFDRVGYTWDFSAGRVVKQDAAMNKGMVAYSPDRTKFIGVEGYRDAIVRTLQGGREVWRMPGHQGPTLSVAYAPDQDCVLTAGADGVAILWDVVTRREVRRYAGHPSAVTWLDFTADGALVLTACDDAAVRVWDRRSGRRLCALVSFSDGSSAVVDHDGRFDTTALERCEGLHWVFPDDPFHPLPLAVYMRDYYEPKLLPRLIAEERFAPVRPLARLNRAQPEVTIVDVLSGRHSGEARVTVRVRAITDPHGPGERAGGAGYSCLVTRPGHRFNYASRG